MGCDAPPGGHYLEEMDRKQSHGCIAVVTYTRMVANRFEAEPLFSIPHTDAINATNLIP